MPVDVKDEERRGERIRGLVETGNLSWTDARLVDDLMTHAAHAATDALIRVAETAPPHLQVFVKLAAMKSLHVNLGNSLEILALASLTGMSVEQASEMLETHHGG